MEAGATTAPRGPLTSPTPWWEVSGPPAVGNAAPAAGSTIPGEGWPELHTVEYMTKLIVLGLLLVATPWVLSRLVASPAEGSRHAAGLLGAR